MKWLVFIVPPPHARLHGSRAARARPATGVSLACMVVLISFLLAVGPARAQEATPAATPGDTVATPVGAAAACVLPLPADAPTSDGTGGTRLVPPAAASPVASPVASPIADGARPGDMALTGALEATANAIAACLSDGEVETTLALTSDEARGQLVSGGIPLTPAEFEALAPTLPSAAYRIVAVEDVARQGDDEARATVTYTVANQVLAGSWRFLVRTVEGDDRWTLAAIEPRPVEVPPEASRIAVETRTGSYVIRGERVPGPTVFLDVVNRDEIDHEVLVLRLTADVEPDVLLSQPGPSFPEGVTYVGDLIIPADGTGTMLLTDLEPGEYTIVDLLPSAEGVPHLATGEVATFTVE